MSALSACTRTVGLCVGLSLATTLPLSGQSRPIDRWLVTAADLEPSTAWPLASPDGSPVFPDRDLELGPGTWHLIREDGREQFDLSAVPGENLEATTLAHVYLKSPRDVSVALRLDTPECSERRVWLNGQWVPFDTAERVIRLAAGWNALLVTLDPAERCAPRLAASIATPDAPIPERELGFDMMSIRLQASRPPGVRPNLPQGTVVLGTPEPIGTVWDAAERKLLATVRYTLAAWGRPAGQPSGEDAPDHPTEPPAADLTGDWQLTLFSPTGIEEATAELAMASDGRLEGRLRGERIGGEIRDGWVSRDRFGWTLRMSGRGRSFDVDFEGIVDGDELHGTMDFGLRDFESRFDGRRVGSGGTGDAEPGEGRGGGPPAGDGPRPGRERDVPGLAPGTGRRDGADRLAEMARQLLPPAPAPAPAPAGATLELRFAGATLTGTAVGLAPAVPDTLQTRIAFDRLSDAALRERGLEARIRWDDGDEKLVGRISPERVLRAFHAPIRLEGWESAGETDFEGTFRVPSELDGFAVRGAAGEWRVDGQPAPDGILCDPCRKGRRMRIGVSTDGEPAVRIVQPGYPGAEGLEDAPAAAEWLRRLRRDPREYLELSRRYGGT